MAKVFLYRYLSTSYISHPIVLLPYLKVLSSYRVPFSTFLHHDQNSTMMLLVRDISDVPILGT
jgi:hypothetical protein